VPHTEFKGSPAYVLPNVFYKTSSKIIRLSAPWSYTSQPEGQRLNSYCCKNTEEAEAVVSLPKSPSVEDRETQYLLMKGGEGETFRDG
jgi:hypothetical protein